MLPRVLQRLSRKRHGPIHQESSPSQIHDNLPLVHDDSIRLFRFNSTSDHTQVQVDLQCFRLSEIEGQYSTLSYTWDHAGKCSCIELNGQKFSTEKSLYDFLYGLRQSKKNQELLWADGVCIDQSSKVEKGHQVRLMGRIYGSARGVLVWLGNEPKDLATMLTLRRLRDDPSLGKDIGPNLRKAPRQRPKDIQHAIHHLVYLNQNRYWSRGWIIQEILLSKSIEMCFGSEICPEDYLYPMLNFLEHFEHGPAQTPYLKYFLRDALNHDHDVPDRAQSLPTLLSIYGTSRCTVPRDRIYALIGLIRESNDPLYSDSSQSDEHLRRVQTAISQIVDYTISPEVVLCCLVSLYSSCGLRMNPDILGLCDALELPDERTVDSAPRQEPLMFVGVYRIKDIEFACSQDDRFYGLSCFWEVSGCTIGSDYRTGNYRSDGYKLDDIVLVTNESAPSKIKEMLSCLSRDGQLLRLDELLASDKERRKLLSIVDRILGSEINPCPETDRMVLDEETALLGDGRACCGARAYFQSSLNEHHYRLKLSLDTIRAFSQLRLMLRDYDMRKRIQRR